MRFSPSFVDRLRNHYLLSEVIGRRIAIKKHGREYQALCPFHNEKSPSFTINDEKGFFHCFGCSAHGDAIEFIKRYERLTYPETIEHLAREAGIALPIATPEERRKSESEKTLHDVCEAACVWFEKQLQSTSGAIAMDYVRQRGLKPETLRSWRIGYAPDERTSMHQYLTAQGFSTQLQADAGLVIIPEGGTAAYDRFRGRVMFAIKNSTGKVVAFGGRLLDSSNKNLPKYLNSPETQLFKKGEMLYNLDLAKRPAREGNIAVVMEGYMDVVSVAQAGVPYALATLGTAVTPEHLRLLWQLAKEPVMCLDGDMAGKRAMLRAIDVALPLLKPGCSLRFAVLPAGEDPDSYIQKNGKAAFEKILQNSKRLSQVIWESASAQFKLDLPEGKAALDDALKQLSAKIADSSVQQHYYSYFKKMLWEKTAQYSKPQKNGKPGNGKAPQKQAQGRSLHVEHMVVQHHSAALDSLTRRMLRTLMQFPSLLHKSQVEETLSRLDIKSAELDAMRGALLHAIGHTDVDDAERFAEYMQSQLPGGLLSGLLDDSIRLPFKNTLSIDDAIILWNETSAAYEISHMEYELQALQDHCGQNMDEASYQRLVEIRQALDKAQNARTFTPAQHSDVA